MVVAILRLNQSHWEKEFCLNILGECSMLTAEMFWFFFSLLNDFTYG